jgi:hypothetical protein
MPNEPQLRIKPATIRSRARRAKLLEQYGAMLDRKTGETDEDILLEEEIRRVQEELRRKREYEKRFDDDKEC